VNLRLYVIHNSHPCDAVARALELKGLPYRTVEWPPLLHTVAQTVIFGSRTVPALRLDAEKVQGTTQIFHRLDALVPEPALFPAQRPAVEAAERWGAEEFQQVARDIIWAAAGHHPAALVSYTQGSRLPLPPALVRLNAPLIVAAERRLNRTDDATGRRRLRELPGQIDRIDAWIEDGTIGDLAHPNAADLQILSTVRLLASIGDVAPRLAASPALELALALFHGPVGGSLPAGALA
jgi:glutathione S-transferase